MEHYDSRWCPLRGLKLREGQYVSHSHRVRTQCGLPSHRDLASSPSSFHFLHTHSLFCLPPTKTAFFFPSPLSGLTPERDSRHQHPDPETRRPKGSTHRFRKGVVPENSGRCVVVLAAVDNHHHREGQGLRRYRRA